MPVESRVVAVVIVASLVVSSCRTPRTDAGVSLEDGRRRSVQLTPGMSFSNLESLMGLPDRTEAGTFRTPEGALVPTVVWVYDWRNTEPWGRGTYQYLLRVVLVDQGAMEGGALGGGLRVSDWSWTETRVR
jgi:hypothetical protein